ncbi:MAG: DNRLRE domain-containing protein [Candidatus Binatia bacterium]
MIPRPLARPLALSTAFCCALAVLPAARAEQVALSPIKDNSIYEESGDLSNGKGAGLFVGQTARTGARRRALLAFDIAGSVPAGATITAVELTLRVTKTISLGQPTSVHRVTADWGEGTSVAIGEEGMGAPATTGDATWTHRFYDTQRWGTEGGDFTAAASATATAGGNDTDATFTSTPGLIADVQAWLDEPQANFGWIALGNESEPGGAKRFASREATEAATRPRLVVSFELGTGTPTSTPVPTSTPATPGVCIGDCDGTGVVQVNELILGVNIALGLAPLSACPAFDPDGSGMVTVADLITAVNNALTGCPAAQRVKG